MLKFKCIGTGSKGNCYVLDHDGSMLILDMGMAVSIVKKSIDYNVMGIVGGIVSHIHTDHSKAIDDFKKMGIKVFTPYLDENPERLVRMYPFTVQIYPLPHNGVTNYGFYIKIDDRRIIYATDMEYIPSDFSKLNLTDIFIECNYQDKFLNTDADNLTHKVIGHCELETCKAFIKHNASEYLRNVIILHMGTDSCNAEECCSEIRQVVPKLTSVDYARAGETYIL